ncbi:MAG: hypothetical protein GXO66_06520 [Euryarchaeota archaeon]|nr:hypothetical protein [Euryarchaeota archaeon]
MKKIYFYLLLFAVVLAGISEGQVIKVIAISNYTLEVNVNEKVHVKNTITVKNLIGSPIVPGIGELRLQKRSPAKVLFFSIPFTENSQPVRLEGVRAYTGDGREIPVNVSDEGDYTKITYEIWYPIEPGQEFTFTVEYESEDLAERGILFRDISIPVGSDMEIQSITAKFRSSWKAVYTGEAPRSLPAGGIAFYTAEFSPLPLPTIGIRWSVFLWSLVLLLSLVVLTYVIKHRRDGE